MITLRQVDFQFEDQRGCLTQLVHKGFDQINILRSKKDVVRGGHYHKETVEAFYLLQGSVEVTARLGQEEKKYVFCKGDFFEVRPYIIHSMFFPEDCIMVQMYNKCVELSDGTKDIFTED